MQIICSCAHLPTSKSTTSLPLTCLFCSRSMMIISGGRLHVSHSWWEQRESWGRSGHLAATGIPGRDCNLSCQIINTLRPRQNGRHFKQIFVNQNVKNSIDISLKFVLKGRIHNITSLVQIMAWCRPGDKPLSEPMMVRLLTHLYASLGLNELTLYIQQHWSYWTLLMMLSLQLKCIHIF